MAATRIKICGVQRVEDAQAASRAGADAVGFVFHKLAGRYVTPDQAREIIEALPPFVTPVGLFVDSPPNEVRDIAQSLGLRHVQLHGHEDPAYVDLIRGFIVLKAIRVAKDSFRSELAAWSRAISRGGLVHLRGIVLETAGSTPGGSGVENDWKLVRQCQSEGLFEGLPPIIAAGGLTPTNVAEVVKELRPWAVDVSSGVEISKGIKSTGKIEAFVRAVRETVID